MVTLYKKGSYKIYGYQNAYIVHNTNKDFGSGHTHINTFKTAKWIIDLAIHKRIPNRKLEYFIGSLIRISDDDEYIKLLKKQRRQSRHN